MLLTSCKSIVRWLLLVSSLAVILLIVVSHAQAAEVPPAANSFVRTNGPGYDIPNLAVGIMKLSKTNPKTVVGPNEDLDYTITFTNTSSTIAAQAVKLDDSMPLHTTYKSCSFILPFTGTCIQSGPNVIFTINGTVGPGAVGYVHVVVRTDADIPAGGINNNVVLTYTDPAGNTYPPEIANWPNTVVLAPTSPGTGSPSQPSAPAEVPEADTLVLMASGGAGMLSYLLYELRRRRSKPH